MQTTFHRYADELPLTSSTHSDAVLLDLSPSPARGAVVALSKAPTTLDVTPGIQNAIAAVLKGEALDSVQALSIGTTVSFGDSDSASQ